MEWGSEALPVRLPADAQESSPFFALAGWISAMRKTRKGRQNARKAKGATNRKDSEAPPEGGAPSGPFWSQVNFRKTAEQHEAY